MSRKRNKSIISQTYDTPPERINTDLFYGVRLDEDQAKFANTIWNKDIDIVFCNSKAGSGKTFISAGVANIMVQYHLFDTITYIISPYGEKKQGWLPGSIEEKSAIYFEPFYQALVSCSINPYTAICDNDTGSGYITCITDTFLRGQNLDNSVVIIDEAQNFTVPQLKKTLTRVGSHSKVIVIGHTNQCDLDDKSLSGFAKYIKHFDGQDRASVCELTHNYRGWISRHADDLEEN